MSEHSENRKDTQDLAVAMARVETKLDTALSTLTDHEQRIRSAEKWRWAHLLHAPGMGAAIKALFGIGH